MTTRRHARNTVPGGTFTDLPCDDLRDLMVPLLEAQSGVYRREPFCCRLREELERLDRDQGCLSVLLVQAGHRPHAASAESIGRFLMCVARQQDMPARLRPGIFALLLPDVDRARAERVGRAVEIELTAANASEGSACRVSPLSYPDDRPLLEDLAARAGGKGRLRTRRSAA